MKKARLLLAAMGIALGGCDPQVLGAVFDRMDGGCRNNYSCPGSGRTPAYLPPPPPTYSQHGSSGLIWMGGGPVVPYIITY